MVIGKHSPGRNVDPCTYRCYIGTYTGSASRGIYSLHLDPERPGCAALELAAEWTNPSYLARHPRLPVLYAVGETADFAGYPGGSVAAFKLESEEAPLHKISSFPVGGHAPCHLAIEREGGCLVTAQYGSGNVSLFPLLEDGGIGTRSDFHQHEGRGPNPRRQEGPHAHCVAFSHDGQRVFVTDLGLDKIIVYRLDREPLRLVPEGSMDLPPGAGPRHLVLSQDGRNAYCVNELSNSVSVFRQLSPGEWILRQTIGTLPEKFTGVSHAAAIKLHPEGGYLYVSNRGHDSLAIYRIGEPDGILAFAGCVPTGGQEPRDFSLTPDGRWLWTAHQKSGSIQLFKVEEQGGRLLAAGLLENVPTPVCLLFS